MDGDQGTRKATAQAITGRSAFLALLEDEGVSHLFGNPGTTELPIMAALHEHPQLQYVLGLQESIVVAMADGYARASRQLAACNVHVAPGLGNAMGALYNAKIYGSPLIVTAGQQEQGHGLLEPMLYDPLVPIATPLVKWAIEVTRLEDLPRIMHRAAKVALTPPTGPVFISLPGDILNAEGPLDLGRRTRVDAATRPSDAALEQLAQRLLRAANPVIVSGHEVSVRESFAEIAALAEILGAPVYQQTVPYTAQYPSEHIAFMGSLNRNQRQVRDTLQPYDLLICAGADVLRMSVHNTIDPLPAQMPIVQISERAWEIGKNYPAEIAINADVRETLRALLPVLERQRTATYKTNAARKLEALSARNWSAQRARLREQTLAESKKVPIDPRLLMLRLAETTTRDSIVVEEALVSGQSLLSFLPFRDATSYYGLASGGIGFAVGGAIGIQLAQPQRPVTAIIGDGSAMYSIQALWTAAHLKLPITYVIANNKSYRILKERVLPLQNQQRKFIAMDFHDPEIDFVALANSMGMPAERVSDPDAIEPALRRARESAGPALIDVIVHDGFG
jgi:benzoylformate decarboxylase